jgi:predicted SnoaL-like aldol condensation-catalyzing enzyme
MTSQTMKMSAAWRLTSLLCVALLATGCATVSKSASNAQQNKAAVLAFYEAGLNKKDFDAAKVYLGPTYTQHNPRAADGVDGFKAYLGYLKANTPDSHSDIVRVFTDGDFVILHVHKVVHPGERGSVIVDIFRLANGKIVEHWDVTQDVPEKTTSGNPMF